MSLSFQKSICLLSILLFSLGSFGWGMEEPRGYEQSRFGTPKRFNRSILLDQETSVSGTIQKTPSRGKAFLLSLILPGAGEYYAGSKKMAGIFFGTEVLLWAAYGSFRTYGNWKKDDYKRFATVHAGIDPAGKDYQYFIDVENYMDIRSYNEAKLQQRDVNALYPEDEEYRWQWDSEASRKRYEKLRLASDDAYTRALFVIGGIVVNHIISGIDALRVVRKHRKTRDDAVQIGVVGLPEGGVCFHLWKCF